MIPKEQPAPSEVTKPAPADESVGADEAPFGAGIDFADPNSPLAFLYARSTHVAIAVFIGLVFLLISYRRVWHTDVWGHLRFGEYAVRHRALPEREMFSGDYADQDALYVNFQWIAQTGAYLIFDLGRHWSAPTDDARLGGGALLLTTAHAAIVTLRLLVLLFVFRRLTGSLRAAFFGIFLVFGMSIGCHLGILRPQIVGELAFAVLLLPLSRPLLSRRAMVLIPLLFVLWANTHGSFLMGVVLLGTFLAGRAVDVLRDNRFSWRSLGQDAQLRRLVAVLAVSLTAAALLNPHGPKLFLYLARLSAHPNLRDLEEWKPLPWQQIPGYVFLASVVALVPVLWKSPARLSATQLFLVLGFGVQTLLHARVFVWWVMVFAWVFVPHFFAIGERLRLACLVETDRPDLRKSILVLLVSVVLFLWTAPAQWFVFGEAPSGAKNVSAVTPLKASAFLKKQFAADPALPRSIYTSETLGEYLLWDLRMEPPVRVFCYTHVHLLTPEHWQECLRVKNGDKEWQEILDRHHVSFVIVEPELHTRLTAQLRAAPERWEIVSGMDPLLVARRKPLVVDH